MEKLKKIEYIEKNKKLKAIETYTDGSKRIVEIKKGVVNYLWSLEKH